MLAFWWEAICDAARRATGHTTNLFFVHNVESWGSLLTDRNCCRAAQLADARGHARRPREGARAAREPHAGARSVRRGVCGADIAPRGVLEIRTVFHILICSEMVQYMYYM